MWHGMLYQAIVWAEVAVLLFLALSRPLFSYFGGFGAFFWPSFFGLRFLSLRFLVYLLWAYLFLAFYFFGEVGFLIWFLSSLCLSFLLQVWNGIISGEGEGDLVKVRETLAGFLFCLDFFFLSSSSLFFDVEEK